MQSIHESAWLAPGAQVYGRVTLAGNVSLWPHAVIRAEANAVHVGRMTNLQDFVMVHVGFDHGASIGEFCSITHHATIHGAEIGDHCLIGIGATIMDGAVIGAGSIVGGGALVPEGKTFPAGSVIVGTPARQVAERDSAHANRLNAWVYHRNAEAYRRGEHRAWDGPEWEAWRVAKQAEIERDEDL